jgi:curved DNA-binding protein CbpA
MNSANKGQLEQTPLAELVREFGENRSTGALRLAHGKAKAVVYCDAGTIVLAASNLRAHRLADFLERHQLLNSAQAARLPDKATDEQLSALLVEAGTAKPDSLKSIRANHVSDILRSVLLWTSGEWEFDSRVRIGDDTRVTIDEKRLLLECARHLPGAYLATRFPDRNETFEPARNNGRPARLLPVEAFVLSRIDASITLSELLTMSGVGEEETLRALYSLALAGLLRRGAWPSDVRADDRQAGPAPSFDASEDDVQSLFARLEKAANYYEMLEVGPEARDDQVKEAYHTFARKYHPDRFHRSSGGLRGRLDSAFAQVARAYETLGNPAARAAYDAQLSSTSGGAGASAGSGGKTANQNRAEASFQQGLSAAKANQPEQALRFFAEAASLEPRNGRYRAEYGRALIAQPQTRRIAEIELKAAISLEPNNGDYRLMMAELYKALGQPRRAAGEIEKALAVDPRNEAARKLLSTLKK